MKRKSILLFGGSGLLGTRIQELLSQKYKILAPTREEVNLENKDDVERIVDEADSEIVVYAAGETNVDKAERDKAYAMTINSDAAGWVAKRAVRKNTQVIYFSTDAVFKGDQSERPYCETDILSPVNYYGITKAKGEEAILSTSKNNLVIRLITLYTSHYPKKLDFARIILKNLAERKPCFGIVDQFCNPTYSDDAVKGLDSVIERKITGIIHFGATDYVTNFQFAKEVAKQFGYEDSQILPITLSEFFKDKKASRAHYVWLDTTKAQRLLGRIILHTNLQNIQAFHATIIS